MNNYIMSNGFRIDLSEDVATPITKSNSDVTQPDKRIRDFSKTINVPGTESNLLYFRGCFSFTSNFDGGVDFDPTARISAKLYKNDELVLDNCVIKLNKVTLRNGNFIFEINLFSEITDIFLGMDKRYLSDLDLSDLNHVLNKTNISSTWNFSKDYVYPLIDIGDRAVLDTFRTNDLYPYVKIKVLLDRIFAFNGFTLNWNLSTNIAKYINLGVFGFGGGARLGLSSFEINQRKAESLYDVIFDWQNLNFNSATIGDLMNQGTLTDNFTAGQDSLNQVDLTNYQTTIALTGKYRVTLDWAIDFTLAPGATDVAPDMRILIVVNGIGVSSAPYTGIVVGNLTNSGQIVVDLDLTSGDVVTFGLGGGIVTDLTNYIAGSTMDMTGTELTIESIDTIVIDGATVYVSSALPKITQKDFVTGIIKWLNLHLDDPDIDGEINVYSYDSYYLPSNNNEDISQIVDWYKDIEIIPIANDYGKNIHFRFKENKDLDNQTYLSRWGANYGDLEFQNPSAFSTGEQIFELPFSNIVPYQGILGSQATFPRFITLDNQSVIKPMAGAGRISLYNGLKTGNWKFANSSGGSVTNETDYPCIHHFDDIDAPTVDANFLLPREVYYTTSAFTLNNAYNLCYKTFINELTNRDARMFICYLKLTNLDITKTSFRKLKYWDGGMYKLNKIVDFDSDFSETTKVELLKVLNSTSKHTPILDSVDVLNTIDKPIRSQVPINGTSQHNLEDITNTIIPQYANQVAIIKESLGGTLYVANEFGMENARLTLYNDTLIDIQVLNAIDSLETLYVKSKDTMELVCKEGEYIILANHNNY